jgi:hypothetical protein
VEAPAAGAEVVGKGGAGLRGRFWTWYVVEGGTLLADKLSGDEAGGSGSDVEGGALLGGETEPVDGSFGHVAILQKCGTLTP